MKKCPACGYSNAEGEFYCGDCGQILQREHAVILATRHIGGIAQELSAQSSWGTARLDRDTSIFLHIRDVSKPLILKTQAETTFGRADPESGISPDFDLTPYGGLENGVSRMHAAILREGESLTLVDKGSSNGTFLNGQQVTYGRARVLRDGDEIRLGRLVCHIYFK